MQKLQWHTASRIRTHGYLVAHHPWQGFPASAPQCASTPNAHCVAWDLSLCAASHFSMAKKSSQKLSLLQHPSLGVVET